MAKKEKSNKVSSQAMSLSNGREKVKMITSVTALNEGQKNVLRAIANVENHIIVVSGIAGTGKTHIAASWGIEQLIKGRFEKIILTRPYVEAGESLGYLPKATLEQK